MLKAFCFVLFVVASIPSPALTAEEVVPPLSGEETAALFTRARTFYDSGSYAQAYSLFERAAEAGLVQAQMSVAYMLEVGQGVMPNPSLAIHWYARAAGQGFTPAFIKLGILYEEGRLVPANLVVANALFRAAHLLQPGDVTQALLERMRSSLTPDQEHLAKRLAQRMVANPGQLELILQKATRAGTPIF